MSYIQKLLTFAAIFLSIVIPAAVLADTPAQQFQTQLQALIGTFRSQITASTTSAADIQTLVTIFQTELQDLQNQLRSAITSEIQVTRPTLSGERFCQAFSQNMGRGSTDATAGGEVTKLQQLLAQDSSIYPEGLVTGFFGSATEGAVQRAQKEGSVVSAGTPDTTGFGFVGPATRGFFYSRWCTEASPSTSSGGAGGGTSGTAGGSGTSSGTSGSTGSGDTTSGSGSTSGGTQNVNFTATPTSGQAPLAVTFSPNSSIGYYAVNFGDNSNASMQQGAISHIYAQAGTYTASFSSDAACLHSTPPCAIAALSYGTVTITVTGGTTLGGTPSTTGGSSSVTLSVNGSSSGATITSGGSALLSWTSANVTSCMLSSNPTTSANGNVDTNNSGTTVGPLTQSTVFTMACTASSGSVSDSITASVYGNSTTHSGTMQPCSCPVGSDGKPTGPCPQCIVSTPSVTVPGGGP